MATVPNMQNAPHLPKSPSIEYEVKCPQTWAWYPTSIVGFDEKTQKFQIKYPNDWKQSTFEDGADLRRAPEPLEHNWRPANDQFCECKAKAEENEPFGWWGCQVKSLSERQNGVYAFIQFDGWPEDHNEMLELEYLRPKNAGKGVSGKHMVQKVIGVPGYAVQFVSQRVNLENLGKRLLSIHYRADSSELVLVGTKRMVEMASNLAVLHFGKAQALSVAIQKKSAAESQLQEFREREKRSSSATFRIHPFLSGYFMTNKQKVESLRRYRDRDDKAGGTGLGAHRRHGGGDHGLQSPSTNVVTFRFGRKDGLSDGECSVKVETEQGLQQVVEDLKIVAKKLILPKAQMPKIIGSGGTDIRALKNNNEVSRIISWSRFPEEYLKLKSRHEERNGTRPQSPPDGGDEAKGRKGKGGKDKDKDAEEDDGHEKGKKGKGGKGKKKGKKGKQRGDEGAGAGSRSPAQPDWISNSIEETRSLLRRYGVKVTTSKDGDGNIIETRDYPPELEEELHNFFDAGMVEELLSDEEKVNHDEEDALVIIGKAENVEICVTMIMLQLNHMRNLAAQRARVRELHAKLRELRPTNQPDRRMASQDNSEHVMANGGGRGDGYQGDRYGGRRDRGGGYQGNRDRDRERGNNRGSRGRGGRQGNYRGDNYRDNRGQGRNSQRYDQQQGRRRGGRHNQGRQYNGYQDDSKDEMPYTPRQPILSRSNIGVRRRPEEKDNSGMNDTGNNGQGANESEEKNASNSATANGEAGANKKGKSRKNKRRKKGKSAETLEGSPQGATAGGDDEDNGNDSGAPKSKGKGKSKNKAASAESTDNMQGELVDEDTATQDNANKKRRTRRRKKKKASNANDNE